MLELLLKSIVPLARMVPPLELTFNEAAVPGVLVTKRMLPSVTWPAVAASVRILSRLRPALVAVTEPSEIEPAVAVPRESIVKSAAPFSPSRLPNVIEPPTATAPPPEEIERAALPSMSKVPPFMPMLPPLDVTLAAKCVLEPTMPVAVMSPADVKAALISKSLNWLIKTPPVPIVAKPLSRTRSFTRELPETSKPPAVTAWKLATASVLVFRSLKVASSEPLWMSMSSAVRW